MNQDELYQMYDEAKEIKGVIGDLSLPVSKKDKNILIMKIMNLLKEVEKL